MVKIVCRNYGFDCNFEVKGNNSEIIKKFQKHSRDAHGIEHSAEGLDQILLRMKR